MALDYSALGKRISNFRNASGFTQEQFCEKLNMSRKHISQIEASTADSEIHRLLLDCNTLEQEILTRMVKELKAILYGLGV